MKTCFFKIRDWESKPTLFDFVQMSHESKASVRFADVDKKKTRKFLSIFQHLFTQTQINTMIQTLLSIRVQYKLYYSSMSYWKAWSVSRRALTYITNEPMAIAEVRELHEPPSDVAAFFTRYSSCHISIRCNYYTCYRYLDCLFIYFLLLSILPILVTLDNCIY